MNKKQLQKQLEEAKTKAQEAKDIIKNVQAKLDDLDKKSVVWKPKMGARYYFHRDDICYHEVWADCELDRHRYARGNWSDGDQRKCSFVYGYYHDKMDYEVNYTAQRQPTQRYIICKNTYDMEKHIKALEAHMTPRELYLVGLGKAVE